MKSLLALVFAAGTLSAAPILYSIAGDGLGVARQLFEIDVQAQTATLVVSLGDGSHSFGGGLAATGSGVFTGIRTDSNGNADLVSYTSAGIVSPLSTLQPGLFGGLALSSGSPYWIRNDFLGDSHLETPPSATTPIGNGFTGGLAWRPEDGLFYAVANDFLGNSMLYSINSGSATSLPVIMGTAKYGGLAWDSGSGFFYVIGIDELAESTLYRFAPGDLYLTELFGLGQGFQHASLAVGQDEGVPSGVPEPGSWALMAAGAACMAAARIASRLRLHHRSIPSRLGSGSLHLEHPGDLPRRDSRIP